jgi:protein-disulfide isomerase
MFLRPSCAVPVALALSACAADRAHSSPVNAPTDTDPAEQAANFHARMEAFRHLAPPADDDPSDDAATVWNVPVSGSPARGNPLAAVTVVEFGDFQCGYCARAEKVLAQIGATYGDRIRIVWKDDPLPFHNRALAAAEFAREARAEKGDAGFWAAHDALLGSSSDLGDDAVMVMARAIGVDPARTAAAVGQNRHEASLNDDLELAADLQAMGTPTFFINGRRLVGAQPFETFKAVIDAEVVRAEALLAQGVPPSTLYDTMVKNGRSAPDPRSADLPIPKTAPFRGNPDAKVVIQEFAEFQCPYCSRAEDLIHQIMARYGADVKLVWRDLPLAMHAHAELAAEAASEARQQKGNAGFWVMHDRLLSNQATAGGLERPALETYARQLGLDMVAFDGALDRRTHAAEVTMDAKAATIADINETPTFIVGGYLIEGAQPFAKFKKIIDRVLKEGPAKGTQAAGKGAPTEDGRTGR